MNTRAGGTGAGGNGPGGRRAERCAGGGPRSLRARAAGGDRLSSQRLAAASSSARSVTRRATWRPCRPTGRSPACCRWCSSAAGCSGASRCRCRFSTTAAWSPTPPTRGGRSWTRAIAETAARRGVASRAASHRCSSSRTSRPSGTRWPCACALEPDRRPAVGAARSEGPQPGPQGREEPGSRSWTAATELVDEFYAVFAHNMRDLGTPVYARAFFVEVLRTFPDTARVFVVRHDGPAGGGVDRLLAPLDDRSALGLGAARRPTRCAPTCCSTGTC